MNHRYAFLPLTTCILFTISLFSQEPKLMLPIGHSLGVSTAVFSPDGKRIVTSSLDSKVKIWELGSGKLLADLIGHTDTVYTASYSPDGRLIVSAGEDSVVKIWDASSAIQLLNLRGHTDKVYTAEFSPDGKKIVTTSADKTVKIWETSSGKLLADLKEHTAAAWSGHFSPDGNKIISVSEDSSSKIWDVGTGNLLIDLRLPGTDIWSAEFSPDGKKAVTGCGDSATRIWDAETGRGLLTLNGFKRAVRFASFSGDGKKILAATEDGTVNLYDAETGHLLIELMVKKKENWDNPLRTVNLTPDGKKILTGYLFDTSAKIWDATTGKLLLDIKRGAEYINSASISTDGKKFALALSWAHTEIYDITTGTLLTDLKGSANNIYGFGYSPDGKRILVSNRFGSAKILDAETVSLVATLPSSSDNNEGVSALFSPDGKKILAIPHDNTAQLYDVVTGALLSNLEGHKAKVFYAQFSPDGKKIYTASLDSTCKVWDATTGKQLGNLKAGDAYVSLRFSKDGKRIMISSTPDSIIKVFDSESLRLVAELRTHSKKFFSAEISPDGKKITVGQFNDTAQVWSAESGVLLHELFEPGHQVRTTTFSPDGKKVVVVFENKQNKIGTIKIYNTETGSLIMSLKQEGSSFRYNVVFSPDDKKIFTPMENGTITIWDAESGKYLRELKGIKGPAYFYTTAAISPDGKKLVAGSGDGAIKIWDIETGVLLADMKEHTAYPNVYFTRDGKKIISASADYTTKVWDVENYKSLYTYLSVNRDDYLVTDNYNHFDGTESARKQLYFTCGTEVIELDQLKDQLWVPNLAERILNGETISAAKLSDLNICNLTPVVDTVGQTALQYRFRITPRLGGLGSTIIYVNGIEVKRYTPQQLLQQKGEYQLAIDKKELQKFFVTSKENSISVKAMTAKNSISSRSVSINEKTYEKSDALPNLYAIVVGVSDYKGEELDLKFAAKDAINMADAIGVSAKKLLNTDEKEHVFIYKVHTSAGRDKFPEKNSIRQLFTEIGTKAQPNDILLIFFAGHGVVESEKNQFYFLTADASSATLTGALKEVGISTEELAEWIRPQVMRAQKRILIFDACNSGQAIKEIISFNQDSKGLLASRGDDKGKQIKAIEKLNEKSGMFILSASASDQKAYEMGKYNQGALTYSLLKAIKEEPDILEGRQYLNISRWFNAAEKSVNELARETGARQQPQLVSTTNFNIGIVDDEVRNKIILPFEKLLFTRSEFRNTESRLDNLKLRNLIDKQLGEIADNETTSLFLYNPEYDGVNIYALNGDYIINGNEATISVLLVRGGNEIVNRFEIKGDISKPEKLAGQITTKTLEWIQSKR